MKLINVAPASEVCELPAPIAIDGPAASGKTTIGEAIAKTFGYLFLDTGLMYRAFALAAQREGVPPSDPAACGRLAASLALSVEADEQTRIMIAGEDVTPLLRDAAVEASVSLYSAIPEVRRVMVERQRSIAASGNAVLAGRDIGSVVLPDAPLKFFLVASEEARAERRSKQTSGWEQPRDTQEARREISGRDRVDASRATSPLVAAEDAIVIDTTLLTLEEVVTAVMEHVTCETG